MSFQVVQVFILLVQLFHICRPKNNIDASCFSPFVFAFSISGRGEHNVLICKYWCEKIKDSVSLANMLLSLLNVEDN